MSLFSRAIALELKFTLMSLMSVLQMSQVTIEKCMEIILEFEPSPQGRRLAQLGIDGKHCVLMLRSLLHQLSIYCVLFLYLLLVPVNCR